MEDVFLIDKLILFGLGRQEAQIYICLLKHGALTGYEVAKITGISRSNVYNALAALVEHGAAYVMEGSSSKYVAVELAEFCDNHIRYLSMLKNILVLNGPKQQAQAQGYVTIEGFTHIQNKIHNMLLQAKQRVYFSAESAFLTQWESEIGELLRKGCKVVLISDGFPAFSGMTESEKEDIIFYEQRFEEQDEDGTVWNRKNQIRLITDSAYALTGTVEQQSTDTCLYSTQPNMVDVLKEGMRNEIKLLELEQKERH